MKTTTSTAADTGRFTRTAVISLFLSLMVVVAIAAAPT